MKAWKVILVACIIFGAGIGAGVLAVNLIQKGAFTERDRPDEENGSPVYRSRLEDHRERFCNRLTHHLELTPNQKERVESILAASQARVEAILKPVGPKIHDEYKAARDQIRAILTAEQREKFDKVFDPRHLHKSGPDKDRGKGRDGHKDWRDDKHDWHQEDHPEKQEEKGESTEGQ